MVNDGFLAMPPQLDKLTPILNFEKNICFYQLGGCFKGIQWGYNGMYHVDPKNRSFFGRLFFLIHEWTGQGSISILIYDTVSYDQILDHP